jgi:hypothetical protein
MFTLIAVLQKKAGASLHRPVWFAGGTWGGSRLFFGRGKRAAPKLVRSVVVRTFSMGREVEPFAFGLFCRTKADGEFECEEQDRGDAA